MEKKCNAAIWQILFTISHLFLGIGPTAYREKYIEMLKVAPKDRKLHDPEKYNTATPNRERGLIGKANRMNIMDQNSDSTNDFSIWK